MTQAAVEKTRIDRSSLHALIILAVGALFAIGVAREWNPLAGNRAWTDWVWTWRDLGIFKTAGLCLPSFLLIAWVLWREDRAAPPPLVPRLWLALLLLALANYLLQVLGMLADPRGIDLVRQIVSSSVATSYFTDAAAIQRPLEWLSHFQDAALNLHSMTHPPGPILFYYVFLRLFAPGPAALAGGCAVGLLASAGTGMMYAFTGLWTKDRRTRLTASAFYALLPALTVFFPEFDQIYPIFSMLLIFCWVKALDAESPSIYAFYAGSILFAATFLAYNLLSIGIFLLYFCAYYLWRSTWSGTALSRVVRALVSAAATCAGIYLALWLATGYHPLAAFREALSNQAKLQRRSYLPFPFWDPYDFLLGSGILALPVILLHLQRVWRERRLGRRDSTRADAALTVIGLATILTIDVSGALRAETTRVWIFLQPLLIAPVALELSRFPRNWRFAIFALQWWILACVKAKMTFIDP